jgi:hypothetical protein
VTDVRSAWPQPDDARQNHRETGLPGSWHSHCSVLRRRRRLDDHRGSTGLTSLARIAGLASVTCLASVTSLAGITCLAGVAGLARVTHIALGTWFALRAGRARLGSWGWNGNYGGLSLTSAETQRGGQRRNQY